MDWFLYDKRCGACLRSCLKEGSVYLKVWRIIHMEFQKLCDVILSLQITNNKHQIIRIIMVHSPRYSRTIFYFFIACILAPYAF